MQRAYSMALPDHFKIKQAESGVGVLHLGGPGKLSYYTLLERGEEEYVVRTWSSLGDRDPAHSLTSLRDPVLRPHINGKTLFVDLTQVGSHFLKYVEQAGLSEVVPVACLEPLGLNPWSFQPPTPDTLFVSLREAAAALHVVYGAKRLNLRRRTHFWHSEEEVRQAIAQYGTEEEIRIQPRLHSLAVACLVAERIDLIVK